MNKSKQWLNEVKLLCDDLAPEDGVDPRILARPLDTKTKSHKGQQLCKEAKHTLSLVLAGELSDPTLQNLEVVDVTTNEDGQFLYVLVSHIDTGIAPDENQILNKLHAIQGYLRSAIAQSVKRKRVPALKFKLVRVPNEVNSDANSKHN